MFLKNRLLTALTITAIGVCFSLKNHDLRAEEQMLPVQQVELQIQEAAVSPPVDPARNIIRRQLAAIQNRDADSAFSMMTETLHAKFDNAKNFLGILHFEYRPIYNYKSYTFMGRYDTSNGATVQKVRIETRYGEPAIVIYRIKKQSAGNWLIDSFTILDNDAQAI